MAERRFEPADTPSAPLRPEIDLLSVSDRTRYVDRCLRLLADRRRRFCLYHLDRVDASLTIRRLAGLVEASLAPPEAEVTDRILDEAVRQLVHVHLPKLGEVGLVQVNDRYVSLVPDSALRVQEWLSITGAVEFDSDGGADWLVTPAGVGLAGERAMAASRTDGGPTTSPGGERGTPVGPSRSR